MPRNNGDMQVFTVRRIAFFIGEYMKKYKLTFMFDGMVMNPINGYACNSFSVTVNEDEIDDDGEFIRIGEYLYPVHNINCIKREIVKDEVQSKSDYQADGA